MKAILVIDLNDTTLNECDTDVSKCWAKVIVHAPIKGTAHGIGSCIYANDNVELKPMPEKKILDEELFMSGNFRLIQARFTGWNDCIDTITGETE